METSKKRPVIAVDVDGVLRNNLGILVKLYNDTYRNIYHKNLGMTVDDVKKFKVEESFPLVEKMIHVKPSNFFFSLNAKEVFLDAPAYDNIKECINRLKEVADVVIVTYQKDYRNKRYTLEWLENTGIDPNGICFLRDKTLVHADALIDDNDWNFLGTHCGTAVLVTQPYNKDVNLDELITKTNSKQIVRVDSFEDFTVKYLNGEIVL
jgi:5'(3')-deoxyribonucleotidase